MPCYDVLLDRSMGVKPLLQGGLHEQQEWWLRLPLSTLLLWMRIGGDEVDIRQDLYWRSL
jgi:hypothetical protein